jgi:L-ribulokinase
MTRYALGLDFGTGSARALLVDLDDGREVGSASAAYASGVIEDAADPDLARQRPDDWRTAAGAAVAAALVQAHAARGFDPAAIVGIGVDTTGSTPLAVDRRGQPLADDPQFAHEPAALAWLWKDHTARGEAEEITALARARRPQYLARCGGSYSSEWFWAKVLRCLRTAPRVFAAAHSFAEACDYVPAWLIGARDPRTWSRSVCAAGHKAMYSADWGGLPDADFLGALAPQLAALRERLGERAWPADRQAGRLHEGVATELGLAPGTPVAVGALDAHLGAVGAGIAEGDLVKVIGTSTCDMAIARGTAPPDVSGLSGVVDGSIVPGAIGFEAGQAAVGDVFQWCAERVGKRGHAELTREAQDLRPGETGLLALDWHNGNRCVLADPALSGAIVGLNLQTRDVEIYRAMIEATAFGARIIVEQLAAAGVGIRRVIACGGIARKSDLLLQIYADVLRRPLQVSASSETCALGAAICGAVAGGAFDSVEEAQRRLCPPPARTFAPDAAAAAVYDELFALYRALHDAFGGGGADCGQVMKRLLAIRRSVRTG